MGLRLRSREVEGDVGLLRKLEATSGEFKNSRKFANISDEARLLDFLGLRNIKTGGSERRG